ncbi:vWA domain-containing protein [Helicobacter sp. 23-1044]
MSNDLIRIEDLVNNPTARIPICLCLDTSSSMAGAPINELNEGVKMFYNAIANDEMAVHSAEICVVTFGYNGFECLVDFSSLNVQKNSPTLIANGLTPLGEAVNLGLDLLDKRKDEYKNRGVDYYQPWMVLMTDGAPNGDEDELRRAISCCVEQVNERRLTIFPIGIGPYADMNVLAQFSPKRPPLRLKGLSFNKFFEWLSKSISAVSASMPGDNVKLDIEGIKGWGEL